MTCPEITALIDQLGALRALISDLSDEDFERPSRCTGWTVAVLVGHLEGMLLSLVSECAEPLDVAAEIDRRHVYANDATKPYPFKGELLEGEENFTVSERIRDKWKRYALGRRPVLLRTAFQFAVDGAVRILPTIPGDRVVRRPPAFPPHTFCELAASRHIEFGIHMMDIEDAVGRPQQIRPESAAIISDIFDTMLGETLPEGLGWDSTTYILTGSGRRKLEPTEAGILGPMADRFPLPAFRQA
jgi:uncharacterized protein (TIGR03083 family)